MPASNFKRLLNEHLGQALTIATGLVDRLVLTAVLLRLWGEAAFEAWSVAIAMAGLMSLFDFGFTLFFSNRLMEETEQHRVAAARHTLFVANTIAGVMALLGLAVVAFVLFSGSGIELAAAPSAGAAALILATGSALRIASSGFHALYRAHRQYGRLALLYTAGETLRITAAIAACVAGGGLLAVALAATAVLVIMQVLVPIADASRRFKPHRIGFTAIPIRELWPIVRTSFGFFAQVLPITLMTSLPVLYLGHGRAAAGTLAAFVLMRTLAGVPRALLQQFSVVLGQECNRRIAVDDRQGALRIVSDGARFYAVLSGVATGVLLGAGPQVSALWTGSAEYFRWDYVVAAVAPMVFAAFAVLAHNIMITTNAPWFGTVGRWVQFVLTWLIVFALPLQDTALAMLIALSLGEIVGFAPIAYAGVARLVPGATSWLYARECFVSLAAAVIATATTLAAMWVCAGAGAASKVQGILLAVFLNVLLIPWIGIRVDTRSTLLQHIVRPRLAMFASLFK